MANADRSVAPTSRRSFACMLGAGAALAVLSPLAARGRSSPSSPGDPEPSTPPPDLPPQPLLLDSNENPYGPPASAVAAITAALPLAARYPDRAVEELVEALAAANATSTDSIALGAGSSQILHAAANAWSGAQWPVAVADPTFEALGRYAEARGARVTRLPLAAGYRHDLAALAGAAGDRGLVYVCNPNNPTATVTPAPELRVWLERLPTTTTVLVDEAYHEYAQGEPGYESVVPWIAQFPNLVVARTFSKIYGLAGLRCGYALGRPERIAELRRQLPWDSSNLAALVAATAALGDAEFVDRAHRANREQRERAARGLAAYGAKVAPSAANFLCADLGSDVAPVIQGLRERGIRVGRRFASLPTHLRVTIGTALEMRAFLAAFGEVWSSAKAA